MSQKVDGLRLGMIQALGQPGAPRVATPDALFEWFASQGLASARVTVQVALPALCAVGALSQARHGLYLNLRAHPTPTIEEIAPRLRQGAVVSLHRVLGRFGVINNPTHWITTVVPRSKTRKVGRLETAGTVFTFNGIKDEFFAGPAEDWAKDALLPFTHVPTATPEKALLDWLYLATTARSAVSPPKPHDLDVSNLDTDRLDRLAQRMGLGDALAELCGKALVAETEASAPRSGFRR